MPNATPTIDVLTNRSRADIKAFLPLSNPYDPAGMPNALTVALANRNRELYDSIDQVVLDTFTATATGQALLNKGLEYGLVPNSPTQAQGTVVFVGTLGSIIPIGTAIQGQNGETYTTELSKTLADNSISIASLTSSGITATATFTNSHGLGSGMTITFSGAAESEYNGDFDITVISETVLQYTLLSSTTSPATGSPLATYTGTTVSVVSENTRQVTNIAGGETLTLSQSIAGVETNVYTQFSGIDGGANVESEDSFRERIQLKQQNPETPFNTVNIELEARKVSGVTRVWVVEADQINTDQPAVDITAISGFNSVEFTNDHDLFDGMRIEVTGANEPEFNGFFNCFIKDEKNIGYYFSGNSGTATGSINVNYSNVQPGQVRTFFVRDNDVTILPSPQEVEDVKNQILTIKPAHTSDQDIIVQAPTIKTVDFTFTTLVPDTTGLRTSIQQNLDDLFFGLDIGSTVTQDAYRNAIQNSFDVETKQGVQQFDLSVPSGNIGSLYNEIIALGDVSYSL